MLEDQTMDAKDSKDRECALWLPFRWVACFRLNNNRLDSGGTSGMVIGMSDERWRLIEASVDW